MTLLTLSFSLIIIIIIIMTIYKVQFSPRQQMHHQQTDLNNSVLSFSLNVSSDMSGARRSTDRLFHTIGPLTEKLRSPIFVLVRGTCNRYRLADQRREWPG